MTTKPDLNLSTRLGPSGRPVLGLKGFSKPAGAQKLTTGAGTVTIDQKPRQRLKPPPKPPRKAASIVPAPKAAIALTSEQVAVNTIVPNGTNADAPAAAQDSPAPNGAAAPKPPAVRRWPTTPEERAARKARRTADKEAFAAMSADEQAAERAKRAERDARWLARLTDAERDGELKRRAHAAVVRSVRAWAAQRFPAAFERRDAPPPLMIGVYEALCAAAAAEAVPLGAEQIAAFIRWWCRGKAYLQAVIADGSMRHDLDGAPVAAITSEHRKQAQGELRALLKRHAKHNEGGAA